MSDTEEQPAYFPELYLARPRPGGYVKIQTSPCVEPKAVVPPERQLDADFVAPHESRDFRVATALDDDAFSDAGSDAAAKAVPPKDATYMLGTAISTLIMMASKFEGITPEHYDWTRKYLECVRDDYGNHPPNVQGMLNYMDELLGPAVEKPKREPMPPSPNRGVRSQIRVKI